MKNKEKIKRTPRQRFGIFLRILLIILLVIAIFAVIIACLNKISVNNNRKFIGQIRPKPILDQLEPEFDHEGYCNFYTDEEFKVMQLTDVHIGGGFLSEKKDKMAINAVAAMVQEEKPDLVVVTGDVSFPVPYIAGTFNNKSSAKLFAELMEKLDVYWCVTFGNHDTESYSYFSREAISELYSNTEAYPHCLFNPGPVDVDGYCNYVINVKKTSGQITQSLIMLDSHSYVDNDYFGIMWKYDTIHKNQVEWYENTLNFLADSNNGNMPKSLCFFHIPVPEYKVAWDEYNENKNTDNVKYNYGKAGESGKVIYTSNYNYGFFDKAVELGSTQAMFCGHDHLNNFSVEYKGIQLNYGYSIDYLAYSNIDKYGLQRGCTIIDIKPDGSFESHLENYYQDKYTPTAEKEEVLMVDYN